MKSRPFLNVPFVSIAICSVLLTVFSAQTASATPINILNSDFEADRLSADDAFSFEGQLFPWYRVKFEPPTGWQGNEARTASFAQLSLNPTNFSSQVGETSGTLYQTLPNAFWQRDTDYTLGFSTLPRPEYLESEGPFRAWLYADNPSNVVGEVEFDIVPNNVTAYRQAPFIVTSEQVEDFTDSAIGIAFSRNNADITISVDDVTLDATPTTVNWANVTTTAPITGASQDALDNGLPSSGQSDLTFRYLEDKAPQNGEVDINDVLGSFTGRFHGAGSRNPRVAYYEGTLTFADGNLVGWDLDGVCSFCLDSLSGTEQSMTYFDGSHGDDREVFMGPFDVVPVPVPLGPTLPFMVLALGGLALSGRCRNAG